MNATALQRSLDFIDSWLAYQVRQQKLPGISIAIYAGEKIVFSRAYGRADCATGEVLRTDHLFNIGSLAKMLTGAAIMKLGASGAIKLDDKVAQYLPWLMKHADERMRRITIRQLLLHEAGLTRDGHQADFWQFKEPFPDEVGLRRLVYESECLPYEDAMLKYSNLGYALLGRIIEEASGMPYEKYVKAALLGPYNLTSIQPYQPKLKVRTASGHLAKLYGKYIPLQMAVPTNTYVATSGWYATAADVCQLLVARFADAPTKDIRGHWRPAEFRESAGYGEGYMKHTANSRQLVGHGGSFVGHASYGYMDRDASIAVAVLSNSKDAPIDYIGEGVWGVLDFFEEFGQMATPDHREALNGRLMNAWQTIDVVATKDKVVCVDPDSWSPFEYYMEELEPLSDTEFIIKNTEGMALRDEKVVFYLDKTGKLKWVNYAGATTLLEEDYVHNLPITAKSLLNEPSET